MKRLFLLAILMMLVGCGGGGGGGASPVPFPKKIILKLSTVSVDPQTTPAGIDVKITLPAGVAVKSVGEGLPDPEVVFASGINSDAIIFQPMEYTAPTTTPGSLRFVLADASNGFVLGEFATVLLELSSNASVSQSDFSVELVEWTDLATFGTHTTGISVVISGFSLQ